MNIYMTPRVSWHLQWIAQRTDCELPSMGILSIGKKGFTVADVVLVKQEISAARVDLDMKWWAERQVELFETRSIQPWQAIVSHHSGERSVNSVASLTRRPAGQSRVRRKRLLRSPLPRCPAQ